MNYQAPRRDSNTSTISSYFSSVRSDQSPYPPLGSQLSSRRSSQTSQVSARLSIINSPYEYDISGNMVAVNANSRRSSQASSTNIAGMTAQMRKATLSSNPNLFVQSQNMSTQAQCSNEHMARMMAFRRENGGWRTGTPCRTPLPHEIPNREIRRASDPVRHYDPQFAEMKKLHKMQRFHSLNTMRPLPVPQSMKSLRQQQKSDSHNNLCSSQSSIATDYTQDNGSNFGSQMLNESIMMEQDEAALEEKLIEDNSEMIIPDDMRQFLEERYNSTIRRQNLLDAGLQSEGPSRCESAMTIGPNEPGFAPPRVPHPPAGPSPHQNNQQQQPQNPQQKQQSYTEQWVSNHSPIQEQRSPAAPNIQMPQQQNQPMACQNFQQQQQPQQPQAPQQFPQGNMNNMQSQLSPNYNQGMGQQNFNQSQAMAPQQMNQWQQANGNQSQNMPQQQNYNQQFFPHQQGMMGQQQGMMGQPQGMMGQQQGMMGQQPQGMMGQQPQGMMGQQPQGMMGQQPQGMMGQQQQGMMGQQQGMMGQPQGMMGPQGGMMHMHRRERESPQVQVPHISQSQIPARAKAVKNQQQQQMMNGQQQQFNAMPNQQNMMPPPNMMQAPVPQPPAQQPQQQQQQRQQQPQPPAPQQPQQQFMPNGQMVPHPPPGPSPYQQAPNNNYMNQANTGNHPDCQMNGNNASMPPNKQMSPGCNKVSSTSDIGKQQEQQEFVDMMNNLSSISTENLIDNLSCISSETMNGNILSPTQLLNRSMSQTSSRYNTPYTEGKSSVLDTSNMVVNDMSSVLTQLAEENKYLNNMRP